MNDNRNPINQQDYSKKRKRRRAKKAARRLLVLALSVGAILGIAWVITGLIQGDVIAPEPDPGASLPVSTPAPVATDPTSKQTMPEAPEVDNTDWNFIGPVQQDAEAMQLVAPDYRMIALPENGRVDMRYFDTVTFVGDSLTQGMPASIPNATYCAYKSISPKGIYDGSIWTNVNGNQEVPMDALVASQPDNVYILLGTNAMVAYKDNDVLVAYFEEMIDAMKERLAEGVNIYLQSITPVVQGIDLRFDLDRIHTLNDMLAQLAWEKDIYFLDLHEAVAGEDGWLRPEFGSKSDGYHLTRAGYNAWVEYLVTHTAYDPRNPYLEGSHYYTQVP